MGLTHMKQTIMFALSCIIPQLGPVLLSLDVPSSTQAPLCSIDVFIGGEGCVYHGISTANINIDAWFVSHFRWQAALIYVHPNIPR